MKAAKVEPYEVSNENFRSHSTKKRTLDGAWDPPSWLYGPSKSGVQIGRGQLFLWVLDTFRHISVSWG